MTEEQWQHIIEVDGHPEMAGYEEELKETMYITFVPDKKATGIALND
ncbi:MAG: hypothetical protein R3E79_30650 [Caldilineaceae bacterium]